MRGKTRWHLLALPLAVVGVRCGSSTTGCSDCPPPPPPPAAVIAANGEGALVVHPSADPAYGVALEAPVSVHETAGGAALWASARFSLYKDGVLIEASEMGADPI